MSTIVSNESTGFTQTDSSDAITIEKVLKAAVKYDASDIFVTSGRPPSFKINRQLKSASASLSDDETRDLVVSTMTDKQRKMFEQDKECNYGITHSDIGKFRVSAFYQRNKIAMVLHRIRDVIPSIDDLRAPKIIKELAMKERGLVIFVGAAGAGKSTLLASIVDYRNRNNTGHILTIEDPIEFDHQHINCVVTQREVGIDTDSYDTALKNALRQAPDVVMIGEIRDSSTMDYAIKFSQTGHLCLSTLHVNNANQAMERVISFFSEFRHRQLFSDLSSNLIAVIAQRLIPKKDGTGMCPAVEVLLNTPLVGDLIEKGKFSEIKDVIKRSQQSGMQTFDQAIYALYKAGDISYEDALQYSDSRNEVRLQIKLDMKPGEKLASDQSTELSIE